MKDLFNPCVGSVLSADIAVPEHEREVRFYSRVLSTGEKPLWREDDLMNSLGMPVIGLGERNEEYAHLPLQWMPHIQVADVADSVKRTTDLGGSVLMHARDDDGSSQWAVLLDPNGAAFGIIPVVPPDAIPSIANNELESPVGRIYWLDLTVTDASASRDFYKEVIGWSVQNVEMKDGSNNYADYNMLGEDGKPAAGVCHSRGINEGLPPVWILYLPVGDLAESIRRKEQEGGKIVKVMEDNDGVIEYAAIQDPVGVYVALCPS